MIKTITSFFLALLSFISSVFGFTSRQIFADFSEGMYNYCPCVFEENGIRHLYYCTNTEKYNVTDHIGYRTGKAGIFGKNRYGKQTVVLSPGEAGSWDSRHVCDPTVIKGDFEYSGISYSYLMAYLGCSSDDCTENKIGLAVSQTPEGPFTKVGSAPFKDYKRETANFEWGVGQPSLINKDGHADVLLFYTKGTAVRTCTIVEEWDFSNLSDPRQLSENILSEDGISGSDGNADCINNADFAYDGKNNEYIIVSEGHPYPTDSPDFISAYVRLTSIKAADNFENAKHTNLCTVGTAETGYKRNHNACLLRDEFGGIGSDNIKIYCSKSETGNDSLWSYRIFEYSI